MFDDPILPGEERLIFSAFFRKMFNFRQSNLAPKFSPIPKDIQLPIGSIIHTFDNMYQRDNHLPMADIPNLKTPFYANETYRKFILSMDHVDKDGPIPITEKFFFRSQNLMRELLTFRKSVVKDRMVRVITSPKDIPSTQNTLTLINHNPLFHTIVRDTLPNYRQFKVILGSILNTACKMPMEKVQYIIVPLSNHIYDRSKFMMAQTSEAPSAIRSQNSFHYFFMMHWLNFITNNGKDTISLFNQYPKERWANTVIVFTVGVENINYAMFWTLHDAKELNPENRMYNKYVNQLNAFVLANMGVTVNEDENQAELDILNATKTEKVVTTTEDQEVVASGPKEEAELELSADIQNTEKDIDLSNRIKSLYGTLTGIGKVEPELTAGKLRILDYSGFDQSSDVVTRTPIDEKSDVEGTASQSQKTQDIQLDIPPQGEDISTDSLDEEIRELEGLLSQMKPFETPEEVAKEGQTFLDEVDEQIEKTLRESSLTIKQKERFKNIASASKKVVLNGKTIEEHITQAVDPKLTSDKLEFLEDQLPDPSQASSSIQSFDKIYMEKFFHKDLAAVALSLNKHGMYLTGIEETMQSDALNRLVKYKMKFEDINGKKHTINFTLPHVDENGNCLVNGVKCALRKQMTNLPICKVSPTRVSLASYYNKTVVEKNEAKAHSFLPYFQKLINNANKENDRIVIEFGGISINDRISSEYADIASIYRRLKFKDHRSCPVHMYFNLNDRFAQLGNALDEKTLNQLEKSHGILFGETTRENVLYKMFISANNLITLVNPTTKKILFRTTFIDMFSTIFGMPSTRLTEWTDIKILDKKFPVGFLLCFQFGLRHVLEYLGINYQLINYRQRQNIKPSDIIIRFKDYALVIPRYPMRNSLILAGLSMFDTKNYLFEDLDTKNVYYELLTSKGFKTNYLKGIEDTFTYFVDAKTRGTLIQMGEPTTFKDLLIRATDMLVTPQHLEASAMGNHRLRSYERFNMIVYNEIMREHASFKRRPGSGAMFSINPNAVLQRILQDQSMIGIEDINPIQEMKIASSFTYTGAGGRTAQAFVVNDRRYPEDGVGTVSEATPDSGSVAITAIAPPDPTIANVFGIIQPKPIDELQPAQILSTPALLLPGATQDDPKRANFISIQLAHQLPTKDAECMRTRTGYERVIAHKASSQYAYSAKQDGKVLEVDDALGLCKIQYKDGTVHVIKFGETYGECADMVTTLKLNLSVKKGDSFKRGEILSYNPEYFEFDPITKQADWKHGLVATVALIDCSTTFEDSNAISRTFGEKLEIQPIEIRQISIPASTFIHDHKRVGDEVDVNDYLMVFEDAQMQDMSTISEDPTALDYLAKLNRKTPKAQHAGTIVKIETFYSIDITEQHPTVAKFVKEVAKENAQKYKFSQGTSNHMEYPEAKPVPVGTKFKGVTFEKDTVLFRFYIQERLTSGIGDKIVLDSSLKSVTGRVFEDGEISTESNIPVDILFSGSSISNRIVNSPIVTGISERVLEELELQAVDIYEKNK
jgi:hypothetical protein